MTDLDIAALTAPLSADNPCGADLDAAEDDDYMNVMVTAETILPPDYIVVDYKGLRQPFDQDPRYQTLDLAGQIAMVLPFMQRTRDLRVLVLLAKLLILSRDIAGFAVSIDAMAVLLETEWDTVHPRAEGGDLALRIETLQRLDEPLVVTALQHAPLFVSKRLGPMSYQRYVAELKQEKVEEARRETLGLDKILADDNQADLKTLLDVRARLIAARDVVERLQAALRRLRAVCVERLDYRAPKINALPHLCDKLCGLVARVYALTEGAVVRIDPSAGLGPALAPEPDGGDDRAPLAEQGAAEPDAAGSGLVDSASAGQALAATITYFSLREPSNPALLLLAQAKTLIGKSFLEAMALLVPDQVPKSALGIGTGNVFTLPLARLAEIAPHAPVAEPGSDAVPPPIVRSRAQAVALLDQVSAYYRAAEPSSPIPLLTDRARTLVGKDFTALLADLVPKDAPTPKAKS